MQAIVKELLSPFSFIKERQNKNGRYNKFYARNGKFWCYKAFGKYIFKHKRKVYVNWQIPESIEDGMNRPLMICDKTGFGQLKKKGETEHLSSYYVRYMLEHMQIDHIAKSIIYLLLVLLCLKTLKQLLTK